jgi:hypothetical protein
MACSNELSQILGPEAALQLSVAFGGTRIYVPVVPGAEDEIAQAIGIDAARKLSRAYGGEQIEVPVGPGKPLRLRARIEALLAQGKSQRDIARELVLSERMVRHIISGDCWDKEEKRWARA